MSIKNKKEVEQYLERLPDKYLNGVIEYLRFLEFKSKNKTEDRSFMFLSEESLAKDWLTPEEEEAWKDL
jgi:hypothetical protein